MKNYANHDMLIPVDEAIKEAEDTYINTVWENSEVDPQELSRMLNEMYKLYDQREQGHLYVPTF